MAPTSERIREMFKPLSIEGSQHEFMQHVDDNIRWTIPGHSPLSGTYAGKEAWIQGTMKFMSERVFTQPLRMEVSHISGGGDGGEWATVELKVLDAKCRNGLVYDMNYCWVCRFDDNEKLVEVRNYLDTKLLSDAVEQNA